MFAGLIPQLPGGSHIRRSSRRCCKYSHAAEDCRQPSGWCHVHRYCCSEFLHRTQLNLFHKCTVRFTAHFTGTMMESTNALVTKVGIFRRTTGATIHSGLQPVPAQNQSSSGRLRSTSRVSASSRTRNGRSSAQRPLLVVGNVGLQRMRLLISLTSRNLSQMKLIPIWRRGRSNLVIHTRAVDIVASMI